MVRSDGSAARPAAAIVGTEKQSALRASSVHLSVQLGGVAASTSEMRAAPIPGAGADAFHPAQSQHVPRYERRNDTSRRGEAAEMGRRNTSAAGAVPGAIQPGLRGTSE